jgi:hypothetical protein
MRNCGARRARPYTPAPRHSPLATPGWSYAIKLPYVVPSGLASEVVAENPGLCGIFVLTTAVRTETIER